MNLVEHLLRRARSAGTLSTQLVLNIQFVQHALMHGKPLAGRHLSIDSCTFVTRENKKGFGLQETIAAHFADEDKENRHAKFFLL